MSLSSQRPPWKARPVRHPIRRQGSSRSGPAVKDETADSGGEDASALRSEGEGSEAGDASSQESVVKSERSYAAKDEPDSADGEARSGSDGDESSTARGRLQKGRKQKQEGGSRGKVK